MTDAHDAAAFLAAEQTRAAAEQALRREQQNDARDALARWEEHKRKAATAKLLEVKPEPADPWEVLLQHVERRAGVYRLYDSDGNLVIRIRSTYILNTILCVEPGHINQRAQGGRLGVVMRKLGWTGPKDMRFPKGVKAKGYARTIYK